MRIDKNTKIYLGQTEIVKIKKGNVVIWESEPAVETDYFYMENISQNNDTLNIYVEDYTSSEQTLTTDDYTTSIEYSRDKSTWTTLDLSVVGDHLLTLNAGEKIYFRNNNGKFSAVDESNTDNKHFISFKTNEHSATGGDILTLVDYENIDTYEMNRAGMFNNLFYTNSALVDASDLTMPSTLYSNCFNSMFKFCESLTNAPSLPATTLADSCYVNMFINCSSLATAPSLPATTLANRCYSYMFNSCYSLTSAPALPATTLEQSCYEGMFSGCSSLTSAPALPATTLTLSCYYQMFSGCSSLTSAPSLPATTLAQSCYSYMFSDCSALTTAPALPATTLESNCYQQMFYGCGSLTSAPAISATTLAVECCYSMFGNCYSLTTAPALPATTLAQSCYAYMFNGCSTLTTPPALPATTLADNCYGGMFVACSSLTTAPELPATTLAGSCYSQMFSYCSTLTSAPVLPATTVENGCYSGMFQYCTALTNAPALPATTLIESCYAYMFQGCSSLNKVIVYADDNSADSCTYEWLSEVAATGTLYNGGSATYTADDTSGIPTGWSSTTAPSITSVYASPSTFTAKSWMESVKVSYSVIGQSTLGIDVPLSNEKKKVSIGVNTGSTPITHTETYTVDNMSYSITITQSAEDQEPNYFYFENLSNGDDYVRIKRRKGNSLNTDNVTHSLEYSKDKLSWNTVEFDWSSNTAITIDVKVQPGEKMYFRNDTGKFNYSESSTVTTGNLEGIITFASNNGQNYGVGGDLRSLINYTDIDNANPTTNGAFACLFSGTTGETTSSNNEYLTDARNLILPATLTKYCCQGMFHRCTALTYAPSLPATTMFAYCYRYMFGGCSSLTTPPTLPATTLANYCYYYMFQDCSSLTTPPTLPATTLASSCYTYMFSGCSALTAAPSLPATNLASYCYQNMFKDCSSLTSAPALPATTLALSCYGYMFRGCTSLVTPPSLPATTLASSCYTYMFSGCSSLSSVTIYATTTANTAFNYWLQNVAASGTVYNNGFLELPVNSTSGIPTGWSEVKPGIQSITANPDTFNIKSYQTKATCSSTITITTTLETTVTLTNSTVVTVGENTGDSTRTLTETIPYEDSSYQVTIVQTANDTKPTPSWNVVSDSSSLQQNFVLNSNNYYESRCQGTYNGWSYATLNYSGFEELVLECINSGEASYDYGIISQPDIELSRSNADDGTTGSVKVFKNFKGQSSTTPVQITIPSDYASHFITIKFRKDSSGAQGNDSLQFKVIVPNA